MTPKIQVDILATADAFTMILCNETGCWHKEKRIIMAFGLDGTSHLETIPTMYGFFFENVLEPL